MARNHRKADEEELKENGERWLLTYSDLITLLLALFIIMYGMSTENQTKVQALSEALTEAFNGKPPAQEQQIENHGQKEAKGEKTSDMAAIDPLQSIYDQLNGYIKQENLQKDMELLKTNHSISIRLKDNLLFKGDSTDLNPQSFSTLDKVSSVISKVYSEVHHITITGNTADLGNRDALNEADSWQLSVNRAVKILNNMTADGVPPEKMSIEGNSHYNPVASNATEQGRASNRRVEITITDGAN